MHSPSSIVCYHEFMKEAPVPPPGAEKKLGPEAPKPFAISPETAEAHKFSCMTA